jgi:ketosteroid isomerase-like protein
MRGEVQIETRTAPEGGTARLKRLFQATVGAEEIEDGLSFLCPDVELDLSEVLDGDVYRGRAAVRAYCESLADAWQEMEMQPESFAERRDVVVALVRCVGQGRGSGVPVHAPAAWVATLREGKIASARFTLNRRRALEAVAFEG